MGPRLRFSRAVRSVLLEKCQTGIDRNSAEPKANVSRYTPDYGQGLTETIRNNRSLTATRRALFNVILQAHAFGPQT